MQNVNFDMVQLIVSGAECIRLWNVHNTYSVDEGDGEGAVGYAVYLK